MKSKNNIDGYERLRIGSNIRKWRSMKEMKQKELATALRMSEAAVSNMENDLTDFSLSQLEDIALALEIEIGQLFCDPQEKLVEMKNLKTGNELSNSVVMDKDLVYALIGSIKQKDEHIQHTLQNMSNTLEKFLEHNKKRALIN